MSRPLRITLTPGLPDPGATGQWLGCDASGAVYVLRWHPSQQCWGALGFESAAPPARKPWAHLVLLRGKRAGFIIGHVEGPDMQPAAPTPRAGFLTAAIEAVARDDAERANPAEPAPAWPALFIFALPVLALLLVALLAFPWPQAPCEPQPGAGVAGLFTCESAP